MWSGLKQPNCKSPNWSLGEISRGAHSTCSVVWLLISTSFSNWLLSHTAPSYLSHLVPSALPTRLLRPMGHCSVTAWSFLGWTKQREGTAISPPPPRPHQLPREPGVRWEQGACTPEQRCNSPHTCVQIKQLHRTVVRV